MDGVLLRLEAQAAEHRPRRCKSSRRLLAQHLQRCPAQVAPCQATPRHQRVMTLAARTMPGDIMASKVGRGRRLRHCAAMSSCHSAFSTTVRVPGASATEVQPALPLPPMPVAALKAAILRMSN